MYRKPYRIKKKKSIFKSFYFWLSILFLVTTISAIYFLFFSPFFQTREILIFGEKRVDKEALKQLVERKLKKIFWLFETKSIFLVNLKEIEKEILAKFPQIWEIKFKRKYPQSLYLLIKEREEKAIFCQRGNCFLMDGEGIVFESEVDNPQLLRIEDLALKEEIVLGKKIIEKELLLKILDVEKKLKNLGIGLEKVLILSQDYLRFRTTEGWEIFIDPQTDIDWQITKLDFSLKEAIPKEKRKNLEYIDLRFGNFAYPKYKK